MDQLHNLLDAVINEEAKIRQELMQHLSIAQIASLQVKRLLNKLNHNIECAALEEKQKQAQRGRIFVVKSTPKQNKAAPR